MGDSKGKTIAVPVDPRNERALVTSGMKAACIGAHRFTIEDGCTRCLVEDHPGESCPDCHGEGRVAREIVVPWDTAKKIYKDMVDAAVIDCAEQRREQAAKLFHDLMAEVARHADQCGAIPAAVLLDLPRYALLRKAPGWLVSDIERPFNPLTRLYRVDCEAPLLQLVAQESVRTGEG